MRYLIVALAFSLGLLCSLPLRAQVVDSTNGAKPIPRFEDFPVTEVWNGPTVPVKLQTPEERLFRTNLRNAAKEPSNFAGHYSFVFWGCGTNCIGGAVVDHQTGKVFQAPLSTNDKGEGHWVISGLFFFDKPPVQVRPNSRLFIIQREFYGKNGYDPDVYYFVWENEQFRLILHTIAGRVINPRS